MLHIVRLAIIAAALVLSALQAPVAGLAAEPGTAASVPSTGDLEAALATLEDPQARARLIAELKALIAAQRGIETEEAPPAAGNVVLRVLSERIDALGRGIAALTAEGDGLGQVRSWFTEQARDPELRRLWLLALAQMVIAAGLGLAAGWLVAKGLRSPRLSLEQREAPNLWLRVPLLATRTVFDVLPIAAFAAAAYAVLLVVQPGDAARLVMLAAINAVVIARAGAVLARLVFTPLVPSLRLVALADATAAYAFVWVRRLINIPVYGYFGAQAALALGLPEAGYVLFIRLLGFMVTAMLFALVLQNRSGVADAIRGEGDAPAEMSLAFRAVRGRLADIWHVLALIYLAAIFTVWVLEIADGFAFIVRGSVATVVIVVVARLLVGVMGRGVRRVFRISAEMRARFPQIEVRANRYVAIVRHGLEWTVWIVAILAVFQAWRIDVLAWFASGFGRALLGAVVDIVLVLVIAALVWEGANAAITRFLEAKDEEGKLVERSARVRTLLPLARSGLLAVVVVISALTILSTLGVEIAPLLAGAGVVGLAVGFGAQTLVKDVITGAFILFENIIAVGDVASVGGHTGVVEAITVRTIRLRDLRGTVYLVPFSSVDTVTNLTKDFSYYLLDVGIAYREEVDEVIEVLRRLLDELREDPEYSPGILGPLEVLGVDRFEDSAVIVRARIKTKPKRQWSVGREYNRRMKARFDELGIEIPFPHQTIYFGVDREGGAPPARVVIDKAGGSTSSDDKDDGGKS